MGKPQTNSVINKARPMALSDRVVVVVVVVTAVNHEAPRPEL